MPLNKDNQKAPKEVLQGQEPSPKSTSKTNALDAPEDLAAIIKGLLNGRLE